MTDKVNYSIVESDQGNLAVQSKIESFGLDHITQKDIVSFYGNFSQYAAWDTGLLPVEGSGILSIRTAGEYTQFAYQHKPGLYHVNWAAYEGGTATSYYVAQPYRIILCDMKEGNLLGARMFYSPYPITHPSQPLYHVNLPNINCKGYRKNAVGWICLYQNEDWSSLPLNERIVRFIERCSGVETYNDANMSETDGTRFYKEMNKPEFLWNPVSWQQKSIEEGFTWTLDETLWIPVLVQSMDQQDMHYHKGVPLTLADALVGDYRAYYYDDKETKPINAVIRPDKSLSDKEVMSYFAKSYTVSDTKTNHLLNNTFQASNDLKSSKGSSVFTGSTLIDSPESHQNSDYFTCSNCGDDYDSSEVEKHNDYYDNDVCYHCFNETYVYIESADGYFHSEDSNIVYASNSYHDGYYHCDFDNILSCVSCSEVHASDKHSWPKGIYPVDEDGNLVDPLEPHSTYCYDCLTHMYWAKSYPAQQCFKCTASVYPDRLPQTVVSTFVTNACHDYTQDPPQSKKTVEQSYICIKCSHKKDFHICPCGMVFLGSNIEGPSLPNPTQCNLPNGISLTINNSCSGCKSAPFEDQDGNLTLKFEPVDQQIFDDYHFKIKGNYNIFHKGFISSEDAF